MNPGLVVKLRPAGPWRIGPDSGARNRVDVIYHSDSLFSAVTSAMARMGSLSDWLDATARTQTPAVCFSSCFPFLDEIVFVVPPRTIWPPTSPALIAARVRWKSARFVPLPMVQAILSGEKLHANQWSVDGASGCLVPAGRAGPFRTSVRWNAAVDRLSGASERHATACIEFRPGSGLWTVVGFADDAARDRWQGPVKAAFRLLADTGFGGERSRGWGRAETPEFIEGSLPEMIIEERRRENKAPIEPAGEVAAREAATDVSTEISGEPAGQSVAESAAESGAEAVAEQVAGPVPEPGYPKEPSPVPPINDPPSEPRPMREPGEPLPETEPSIPQPETDPEPPPPDPDPEPSGPPILEPVFVRSDSPLEAVLLAPAVTAEMRVRDGSEAAAEDLAAPEPAPESELQSAPASEVQAAPESHAEPPVPEELTPLPAVEPAPESELQSAPESHAESAAPEEPASLPAVEPAPELQSAPESRAEPELQSAPEPHAAPPSHAEPLLLAAGPRPPSPVLQAHWLLSLFTPAPADTVDWGRGSYTVLARGGRVESPSGSGELKKQIQMVAEGSVLYADGVPRGAAADVAPDGFAHPVFRAGFALSIRLPEVH